MGKIYSRKCGQLLRFRSTGASGKFAFMLLGAAVKVRFMKIDEFRAGFEDERTRRLLDYWLSLRGGRVMPSRRDLDPAAMKWGLANLWIAERGDGEQVRIRLAGDRIDQVLGRTARRFTVQQLFPERYAALVEKELRYVMQACVLSHMILEMTVEGQPSQRAERLALPLSEDDEAVTNILGIAVRPFTMEDAFDYAKERIVARAEIDARTL